MLKWKSFSLDACRMTPGTTEAAVRVLFQMDLYRAHNEATHLFFCFITAFSTTALSVVPLSIYVAAFLKNMRTNEANAQAWIYTRER